MLAIRLVAKNLNEMGSCVLGSTRNFVKAYENQLKTFHTSYKWKEFITTAQKRFYVAPTSKEYEKSIKLDGLELVYCGELTSRMKAVKFFSLSTTVMGIILQPILFEEVMKASGTAMTVAACLFVGFFTFVTPLLLHFITKKYITEIYYNSTTKEYTAITISILLQKIQTTFHPSGVTVPAVPGVFTTFMVGKKAFFLNPSSFGDPDHYAIIMGYNKPIDFKLNLKNVPSSSKPTKSQ